MESVSALLDDATVAPGGRADRAARVAEDRAITVARARQARARAEELGRRVERLWQAHGGPRDTPGPRPAPASEVGLATGMVMQMYGLTADQAGHLLTMVSWLRGHPVPELARQMVRSCEEGTDPSALLHDADPPPHQRAPLVVRRAARFIQENAGRAITLDDIAEAAGVGARGLQYAFRRHRGDTPTQFLRRVRMDRVHHELMTADPTQGDTVAAIAGTWHFTHPGRFATSYREVYGVPPSETLRR